MRELIAEELADLLSVPARGAQLRNFFNDHGIRTMSQLLAMTPQELLWLRGFGPVSYRMLKRALAARGLRLGEPPAATTSVPPGIAD